MKIPIMADQLKITLDLFFHIELSSVSLLNSLDNLPKLIFSTGTKSSSIFL